MKRGLALGLIGAVGLGLGAAASMRYAWAQASKPPEAAPANFRPPQNGEKVVVCLGDSITHGVMSYDYVDLLARRLGPGGFVFVNAGVNGNLAYNALQRLDEVIACRPDYVTVLLGTNDASATLNAAREEMFVRTNSLPEPPTKEWFRANLLAIVRRLKSETGARIALLSLPVIGEEPDSEPFKRAEEFSRVIKALAAEEGVAYLPLNEQQVRFLAQRRHKPGVTYADNWALSSRVTAERFLLGRSWDQIAAGNGLLLTVDNIHLNGRGATMIADLIAGFLQAPVPAATR